MITVQARIDSGDLLNPKGKNDSIEEISDETLVGQVVSPDVIEDQESHQPGSILSLSPFKQQPAAVALFKRMCDAYDSPSALRDQLAHLQRSVRYMQSHQTTQTTLDTFLK